MGITRAQIRRVARAFSRAGDDLKIDIEAPFLLMRDEIEFAFAARVTGFGNRNGMAVGIANGADATTMKAFTAAARTCGLKCSFVNWEIYSEYDPEVFKETLRDWGYFGPIEDRPIWLVDSCRKNRG